MSKEQPVIRARTLLHRGKKFDFEVLTVERPGVGGGKTLQRENVRHPGAVVVVAILENVRGRDARATEKSVVLIRNFRISIARPLLECCAGTIERPRLED